MFNSDKKDVNKDFGGPGNYAPVPNAQPTAPHYPWPHVPTAEYYPRPEGAQLWGPPPSYDHVMQQNIPVYPAHSGHFPGLPPGMAAAYAPQQVPGAIYPTPFAAPPTFQAVQAGPPPGIPAYAQQTMPQVALFDPGARYGGQGGSAYSVPPPPPGYAPSAAQLAAMQGQPVQVQKPKNNFFTGGKGSGFTFW
uniref:DAZ-associated protein 2 n=1 Tax=Nyssomyia neivai TaxID=330878 RepID=A0A1L8DBY1_9DIPT